MNSVVTKAKLLNAASPHCWCCLMGSCLKYTEASWNLMEVWYLPSWWFDFQGRILVIDIHCRYVMECKCCSEDLLSPVHHSDLHIWIFFAGALGWTMQLCTWLPWLHPVNPQYIFFLRPGNKNGMTHQELSGSIFSELNCWFYRNYSHCTWLTK